MDIILEGGPLATLNVWGDGSGSAPVDPAAIRFVRWLADDLVRAMHAAGLEDALDASQRSLVDVANENRELHRWLRQPLRGLHTSRRPQPGQRACRLAARMLAWIEDNFDKPVNLGDLAQAFHRTPSYLSTLFSSTIGIAFHAYVDRLRLAKAKDLLADPLVTVEDVAIQTGYVSADWFRHAFKTHTGLSPSAWRQGSPSPARRTRTRRRK